MVPCTDAEVRLLPNNHLAKLQEKKSTSSNFGGIDFTLWSVSLKLWNLVKDVNAKSFWGGVVFN